MRFRHRNTETVRNVIFSHLHWLTVCSNMIAYMNVEIVYHTNTTMAGAAVCVHGQRFLPFMLTVRSNSHNIFLCQTKPTQMRCGNC